MKETPFYFANDGYNLFGILHEPEGENLKKGFVFCYPFEEEKLWVQRVFVNFARNLAHRGYSVLRFDFMGEGDSEGDFENSTIETRLKDLDCAVRTLKSKTSVNEINLLGLRFGATLAALYANQGNDIIKLILWDPILEGSKYINDELRKNLTTQSAVYKKIISNREALVEDLTKGKTVNIDGYELSEKLYKQASDINLLADKKRFTGKGLVVQISRNVNKIDEKLNSFCDLYKHMDFKVSSEFPFWKEIKVYYAKAENLYNDTLKWLNENKD